MADTAHLNTAAWRRDKRLRRMLLLSLQQAAISPKGGLHGRAAIETVDAVAAPDQGVESDGHGILLLRYLVAKGYAAEQDVRKRRTQPFGLDYLFFAITSKGVDLLEETIPADPGIDDERNLDA